MIRATRIGREQVGRNDDALAEASRREWDLAVDWAQWLLDGNQPQAMDVWGLVLDPGETVYLQTSAKYSRLYGGDGKYMHSGGIFATNPGMFLALNALNAAVNAQRKAAARRDMELMWRDLQDVAIIGTNHRLICNVQRHGWLSFYFNSVSEFYPEPANWMVTFAFQNSEPLRLEGLTAPTLAVFSGWCVLGDRWSSDPGLAPVVEAAEAKREIQSGRQNQQALPRIPGT